MGKFFPCVNCPADIISVNIDLNVLHTLVNKECRRLSQKAIVMDRLTYYASGLAVWQPLQRLESIAAIDWACLFMQHLCAWCDEKEDDVHCQAPLSGRFRFTYLVGNWLYPHHQVEQRGSKTWMVDEFLLDIWRLFIAWSTVDVNLSKRRRRAFSKQVVLKGIV